MNKSNFIVGMGLGIAVGSGAAAMLIPNKKGAKTAVSKTLKTMSDMVDAVSNSLGK